ncbi:Uncharacterized protein GBIM_01282 [Gryllus bimaculatus]|nr:Uncharacterized protein GBIM_01282 [Gryllus bimaculatus]
MPTQDQSTRQSRVIPGGSPASAATAVPGAQELPAGAVGGVARACDALQELRCEWAALVTDDDVRQLVRLRGARLRVLVLGGEALSDDAYLQLVRCPRLQELGLAPCGAASDDALLRGVAALGELRALQMTDAAALSPAGLRALLAQLASAPHLRSVALAWCPAADDAALELLADRCQALERVSLRQLPALGDRGVAALLRACKRLTHLSLVWNDAITGRHFLPLVAELAPRLRHLDLGYCDNIPQEAVDALVRRRPALKVTRPQVWCRPRKTAHACCERWTSS